MQDPTLRQPKRVRVDGVPNLYRRPKDGKFECGYTGTDGRWHIQTLAARNLTEAKKEKGQLLSKRDKAEDVAPSKLTFGNVAAEYFADLESQVASGHKSERTLEIYRQQYKTHVKERLDGVRVQAVTKKHVLGVISHVRAKKIRNRAISSSTVEGAYRLVGLILGYAVDSEYRATNPASQIAKERKPKRKNVNPARVLTAEEIEKLIKNSLDTYRPLIATLSYSGLRLSEALGLTWEDVDFENGELHVCYQLSRAKRDKPARRIALKTEAGRRDVILLPQLETILRAHRKVLLANGLYPRADSYVFCTQTGAPMYCRNVSERGIDKAADRAGLNPKGKPKLTAHDLRHSFASHLIRTGADVYSVSRQLGHSRASVTLDVYAHEFEKVRNGDALRQQLAAAFTIAP